MRLKTTNFGTATEGQQIKETVVRNEQDIAILEGDPTAVNSPFFSVFRRLVDRSDILAHARKVDKTAVLQEIAELRNTLFTQREQCRLSEEELRSEIAKLNAQINKLADALITVSDTQMLM